MIQPRLCTSKYPVLAKKWYPWDHGLLHADKFAPTLSRQMGRHNYVIGRKEYIISTLSESIFPWIYSLQFLFKSTHHSWRYERKCEWLFFSEHSVVLTLLVTAFISMVSSNIHSKLGTLCLWSFDCAHTTLDINVNQ